MSVFEKNGMLQRQEQIEVKRRENAILAGPGSDQHKLTLVNNLYRERGLEPGSFYRSDFDQTRSGSHEAHHDDEDASVESGGSLKPYVWTGLVLFLLIVLNHYFPYQMEWVWEVVRSILQFIFGLIGLLINWFLKL